MSSRRNPVSRPAPATGSTKPLDLKAVITAAMDFEHRTMQIYCRFEDAFAEPEEVRAFWFVMARHESQHFGALALVAALLGGNRQRPLPAAPPVTAEQVEQFRSILDRLEEEARGSVSLPRALEMAVEIESSEVEDLVLALLSLLKGARERERAVRSLIHDLGDLSYMIEKYARDRGLLARVDSLIEEQVERLGGGGRSRGRRRQDTHPTAGGRATSGRRARKPPLPPAAG
jgi:hypothetical protein